MQDNYRFVTVEISESIAVVKLSNPPYHDLTREVFKDVEKLFNNLDINTQVKAVILTSDSERYFCNGLSPDYVLGCNLEEKKEIFRSLFETCIAVYGFSKPLLCAINGHAMAGGAVLASLADWRFIAEGKARFSFTEVAVGLPIPHELIKIGESFINRSFIRKTFMESYIYKPEEALEAGIADRVVQPEVLLKESIQFISAKLKNLSLPAMIEVKRQMRFEILENLKHIEKRIASFDIYLQGDFIEGLQAVKERRRPFYKN